MHKVSRALEIRSGRGGAKWERLGVVGCLCSAPNQVQQQHKYGVVVVVVVAAVGSRGKITVIPIQQSRIR